MGAALCQVLRDQVSQKHQDTDAKLARLLNKVEELSAKLAFYANAAYLC